MYERCRNAGADLCNFKTTASSEDELRAKLNDHVRAKHRVNGMTETIYGYLRARSSR